MADGKLKEGLHEGRGRWGTIAGEVWEGPENGLNVPKQDTEGLLAG